MKKIIVVAVLCISLLFVFTGCESNMAVFNPGNYSYSHVHFSDTIASYCATVEKWHNTNSGVKVKTTEFGSIFLAKGTYMLFETDNCPFCK